MKTSTTNVRYKNIRTVHYLHCEEQYSFVQKHRLSKVYNGRFQNYFFDITSCYDTKVSVLIDRKREIKMKISDFKSHKSLVEIAFHFDEVANCCIMH